MNDLSCFVAVEFVDDPNVVGFTYWYLCLNKSVSVGDTVVAPLGRHNNLQEGVVRRLVFASDENAPFPIHMIKRIKEVKKIETIKNE